MPNFLADYVTFTSGDEVPENYRIWSAIATLASVLGRRVWVDWGRFRVYPNLYIIFLGPPGNGKTTAMSDSKQIIRELTSVPFSAECQTKESLCKELVGYERAYDYGGKAFVYTPVSIFVTELSHFLGPNSGHMIDFLTTVYDSNVYDNKTKNKGGELIIGPCVNLLGCTTPQWITTYLRSDIISGGFTRRVNFINEEEGTERIPFPEMTPEQHEARTRVIELARQLTKVCGPFTWLPTAREYFREWYTSYKLPDDPNIRWYHRTKHIQLLKVLMCLVLGRTQSFEISIEDITLALDVFEKFEGKLATVFQGMGRNELHQIGQKALQMIKAAGGRIDERQFDTIMNREANTTELFQMKEFLQKTGQIQLFESKNNGYVSRVIVLPGQVPGAADKGGTQSSQGLVALLNKDLSTVACPPESPSPSQSGSSMG